MTTDYAQLADVRAWLKVSSTDDDLLLSRMITAASAWIATYLSREVVLSTHTETYDGVGGLRLCLAQSPIVSVQSVAVDGVAIDASRFRKDSYGVVMTSGWFTRGYGNVIVSYTAGFDPIPSDIEQCAIDIVAHNYRRRERIGHVSKSIGSETVTFTVSDVPPECKQVLNQYRRVVPL